MATRSRRGRPPHDDVLTPGEWRVVHAVKHGMTNREIAARQGITLDAVKFHVSNVMSKLGIDNRRSLRQWAHVPKGSALSRQPRAPQLPAPGQKEKPVESSMSLGRIGQISRTVRDITSSQDWYARVLGLPHLYTFGQMAFFDCGGTRLILTQHGDASPSESILYWLVPDIVAAHRELLSRGVEFINAPHMIHRHADGMEEWMAFFKDPEGRPMAVMSQARA